MSISFVEDYLKIIISVCKMSFSVQRNVFCIDCTYFCTGYIQFYTAKCHNNRSMICIVGPEHFTVGHLWTMWMASERWPWCSTSWGLVPKIWPPRVTRDVLRKAWSGPKIRSTDYGLTRAQVMQVHAGSVLHKLLVLGSPTRNSRGLSTCMLTVSVWADGGEMEIRGSGMWF